MVLINFFLKNIGNLFMLFFERFKYFLSKTQISFYFELKFIAFFIS